MTNMQDNINLLWVKKIKKVFEDSKNINTNKEINDLKNDINKP